MTEIGRHIEATEGEFTDTLSSLKWTHRLPRRLQWPWTMFRAHRQQGCACLSHCGLGGAALQESSHDI